MGFSLKDIGRWCKIGNMGHFFISHAEVGESTYFEAVIRLDVPFSIKNAPFSMIWRQYGAWCYLWCILAAHLFGVPTSHHLLPQDCPDRLQSNVVLIKHFLINSSHKGTVRILQNEVVEPKTSIDDKTIHPQRILQWPPQYTKVEINLSTAILNCNPWSRKEKIIIILFSTMGCIVIRY